MAKTRSAASSAKRPRYAPITREMWLYKSIGGDHHVLFDEKPRDDSHAEASLSNDSAFGTALNEAMKIRAGASTRIRVTIERLD